MRSCPAPSLPPHQRLLAVVVPLVWLAVTLAAGTDYAWCPFAQRAHLVGCCVRVASVRDAGADRSIPRVVRSCCELQTLGQPPAADRPGEPGTSHFAVPTAAVVLPAAPRSSPDWQRSSPLLRAARHAPPVRAGPRFASDRCSLLRVFRD